MEHKLLRYETKNRFYLHSFTFFEIFLSCTVFTFSTQKGYWMLFYRFIMFRKSFLFTISSKNWNSTCQYWCVKLNTYVKFQDKMLNKSVFLKIIYLCTSDFLQFCDTYICHNLFSNYWDNFGSKLNTVHLLFIRFILALITLNLLWIIFLYLDFFWVTQNLVSCSISIQEMGSRNVGVYLSLLKCRNLHLFWNFQSLNP